MAKNYSNYIYLTNTCFQSNPNITSVDCRNIPWYDNSMIDAFNACESLTSITNINENVNNMNGAFNNCINLVTAPTIPNSVTNMAQCFGCTAINEIPNIPVNVINIRNCFINCNSLTQANVYAPECTDAGGLFRNCQALTEANITFKDGCFMEYTFINCISLVTAPTLPNNASLQSTFRGCCSLTDTPEIPNNISSLAYTFSDCNNLVNVANIPNSMQYMSGTFQRCYSLVTIPEIPDSVIRMSQTFWYCNHLTTVPKLSNSVTGMNHTFIGCAALTTIPNIPSSVTGMYGTFDGCTSLTGNIYIKSNQITDVTQCFNNTSLQKNVYIPYEYENGQYTTTYNAFINAGYNELGTVNGVYLKDLAGSRLSIIQTPSDATVLMYDTDAGKTVDLSNFTYTKTSGAVEIQTLNTQNTSIVVPSLWTFSNSIKGADGDNIIYEVFKEGYETVKGNATIGSVPAISVELQQITPPIATDKIFTIIPLPTDATVTLTASGATQSGNSISVPAGTEVSWTVSRDYCTSKSGTIVINNNYDMIVTLEAATYTLTINSTPVADDIEIFVNGELANASNSDWIFTAYDGNNNIELQNYIGVNTDVVLPTTYEVTNAVQAIYSDIITYYVKKDGYVTLSDTISIHEDTTLNLELHTQFTPETRTFTYTGDVQTYTVPQGTTKLIIDCVGAAGAQNTSGDGGQPGKGGRVQCKLIVLPDQVLNIYVGGAGISAGGGWNGGGVSQYGLGGGGASDIRINGTALTDRKIIAGAGGGPGTGYLSGYLDAGNGGGLIGQNGGSQSYEVGGFGGTQSEGGAGGYYRDPGQGRGGAGSLGNGGSAELSGGGGAGYYGGGGGNFSSGGGGSSYTDPDLCTDVVHTQGYSEATGNGWITITTSNE